MQLPSSFFSPALRQRPFGASILQYWHERCLEKLCFILSNRSDLHMTKILSIAVHAIASQGQMSFSVDETLLSREVNLSISFEELTVRDEMSPLLLKHVNSILPMRPACSFQTMQLSLSLGGCICQEFYVISVVRSRNHSCGVSSASRLCQSKAVFFH